ncbi:MAG: cupin domain-containing protein [Chromatiales bacterium]|jgi:50S ribosomal protein L16 3-hydroxylase
MPKLALPDGVDTEGFLHFFWQKKPLLMRAALPTPLSPITPEELAGLACEEGVESRILVHDGTPAGWKVRHGPFSDGDFAALPKRRWTLLVQDLDKHVTEVAALLEPFRFLPDWRIDDVMASYAAEGGSVGPHVDEYDVFLVQGVGQRRWRIQTRAVPEDAFLPGLELRILPGLEPEQEWVLSAGDVLYLPPGVAHWGTAEGGGCMTYSVGFRAPSHRELVTAYCDDLAQRKVGLERYRDGPLTPARASAEITPDALSGVRRLIDDALQDPPEARDRWFGRFITEPKPEHFVDPAQHPLAPAELYREFESRGMLLRNGLSRMAFIRGGTDRDYLYVNGQEYALDVSQGPFLEVLTQRRRFHFGYLAEWLNDEDSMALLAELFNEGHLYFADE